ncbi:MAG TPA: hypothetical protein PL110_05095 [Candidatus Eremiobacteraeota bacterium]|nr:MAG: hypothetical protein BWY64_00663 [bacterium ADurb.Bin363]HPZ07467.1 hypothetical protein [Candidatus Eremiobacteraeota bacterium]
MDLEAIILTIEDFLEERIKEDFFEEEINDTLEELQENKEEIIRNNANQNLLDTYNLVLSALDDIIKYFTIERNKEYIKTGLDKIRDAHLIFKGEKLSITKTIDDLIASPEPDFIPSGMKSKIPSKSYYTPPTEPKEQTVEYLSDPIDSPLYSLLTGYQELQANKINSKEWLQKLIETEEELNYLLDKTEDYPEDIDVDMDKIDVYKKLILRAIRVVEDLQIDFSEGDILENKFKDSIKKIRNLNMDVYNLQQTLFTVKKEELNIKDSIQEAFEKFEEEDFRTSNYMLLEKDVQKYLQGCIKEEELLQTIKKMRTIIMNAQDQYDNLPVSQEELTLEVLRGDKLLTEGLMLWMDGLDILEDCAEDQIAEEEAFLDGLKYIFIGNKKLVILQYFSDQIQKQVQLQKTFQEGS